MWKEDVKLSALIAIFQAISKIDTNLFNVLIHFSFMPNDFCRSIHFTLALLRSKILL